MNEEKTIQQIVSRYFIQFPEWRMIRKFTVVSWSAFYRIALVEKEHLSKGLVYELYLVLFPVDYDSVDDSATCVLIRDYHSKVKAFRAFKLLTNVNYY